ncbi:hypothetical protein O0882_08085 [Janthinobacterium sp. SUN073]|uniref:hypothetical protein n=1 Tax=Janthinobacterium sp. SUN073 TaxID=3004102 RepID=UPI0025B03E71|nr:hypothetical protein [Janthinobacterium sp. SUN073]MDN2696271.1 hypothetical protein [Janthinobacterium sp. SUN073]
MCSTRKAASPLSRVLASSNDGKKVMYRFFGLLSSSAIRAAVRQVAKHRHFSRAINLSRPPLSQFYEQLTPDATFEKEVSWCLGILDLYKSDVNAALNADGKMLSALFDRNWASFEAAIDELEQATGYSMWSLALRGAALTAQGKTEEKRQLLTDLDSSAKDNRFFAGVLYLKMNRLDEADILSGQSRSFEQKIKRTFSEETLHFLMYKIVQHNFDFDLDFSLVLRIEKNSCPIDIFHTLQDFTFYSRFSSPDRRFSDLVKNVGSALGKMGGESPTKALSVAYGVVDTFSVPTNAYDILDAYTRGDYEDVCGFMEANLQLGETFVLFETWAKAAARCKRFPEGYRGRLLRTMASVLQKDDEFGISNAFLLAQCESFGGLSWFRELHLFIIRETIYLGHSGNKELNWISWASSGIDTPLKLLILQEPNRAKFRCILENIAEKHLVVKFIISTLGSPKQVADFPVGVERKRLAKYLALSYAKGGNNSRALRILRVLANDSDRIVSHDATRELVALLIAMGNHEEAVQRYVRAIIGNPALQRAFDTNSIAKACEKLVHNSTSIEVPIALSLHSRFVGEENDATLRFSFEMFLDRNSIITPDAVVNIGLDEQLVNYFLEFVAVPSVMKLLPVFETLADIEKGRISVCRLLIERQHNVEEMIDEVKYRNRQLVIAAGTKLVESSRIYADTGCFSNAATSIPYRQLFERYISLVRRNDYHETADEIEFTKLLKAMRDEPLLVANMHKIHLQSTVLNEKNGTFLQLMKMMRDEFTFGVRGLAGYLSTRIRHGHLPNILRRSISDEDLLFSRNLITGVYKNDARWFIEMCQIMPSKKAEIDRAFHDFSATIDGMIDEVNDTWLQIFAVDQDISGLSRTEKLNKNMFNYSVTALEAFHLQDELSTNIDYSDFTKAIIIWLWERTEKNLQVIRTNLNDIVRPKLLTAFIELERTLQQSLGEFVDLSKLIDAISRAKLALNNSIDTIEGWFVRSRGAIPTNFESVVSIEIARLSSQVPHFEHEDQTGLLYKGNALSYFVDFLFVLLDNCVTKSETGSDLVVETSFKIEGSNLKICVANSCADVKDIHKANKNLDFYREHYGKESYAITAAQGEGGSGLFKVWKALSKDLELPHEISFGYTNIERFEVTITIKLDSLSEVIYHENSVG